MATQENKESPPKDFVLDMEAIRKRAREHLSEGAVTEDYKGSRETIVKILNDSLATELVCVLRYKRHQYTSAQLGGIPGYAVSKEFAQHAAEEQAHADLLAERIVQLGGEPNFDPSTLTSRSHAQYVAGKDLEEMIREDLIAERIAIDIYSQAIRFIGEKDSTTRRMLEGILEQEEEHADDMSDFLQRLKVGKS